MTRRRALRQLYSQYQTECAHGWYDGDADWRRQLRELYPVEYISAYHRREFPPSFYNDHARRFAAFTAKRRAA